MSWIDKILPSGVRSEESGKRSSVPEGLWKKCVKCEAVLYRPDVERNNDVCPKCDHHMRIGARRRLAIFLDDSPISNRSIGSSSRTKNPIKPVSPARRSPPGRRPR